MAQTLEIGRAATSPVKVPAECVGVSGVHAGNQRLQGGCSVETLQRGH